MWYFTFLLVKRLQKYLRSKLEVAKKIANSAHQEPEAPGAGWTSRFLIDLQLWPLIFLQPLNLQECTVTHLKDLIHICLGPEAQGLVMTFNRFYVRSKYPYFISYGGKWVCPFFGGCIMSYLQWKTLWNDTLILILGWRKFNIEQSSVATFGKSSCYHDLTFCYF